MLIQLVENQARGDRPLLVLGIDPGTVRIGYGLVRGEAGELEAVDYGCIRVHKSRSAPEGLLLVFEAVKELIRLHQPDTMAVEQLFFNKNVRSALAVGQARGAILLAGAEAGLLVHEYTPLELKSAVVGYARADKRQVQHMTCQLLHLRETPQPADAADALACAITCLVTLQTTQRMQRWEPS